MRSNLSLTPLLLSLLLLAVPAGAQVTQIAPGVLRYGDEDKLGYGYGTSDPKAGTTLLGLAPGAQTAASLRYGHGFPFNPAIGEFAGTDQIYVGTTQTAFHDGYSGHSGRIRGPQVLSLFYGALVPAGHAITSFTLGIALDDFQNPVFGQPFTVAVNGSIHAHLTSLANSVNQTGPVVQFFTVGLDPAQLAANHTLALSINQGGTGGDGWAVDFLTVGVTTQQVVPEPVSMLLLGTGLAGLGAVRRRRRASREV